MLLSFLGVGDAGNYRLGSTSAFIELSSKTKLLLIDFGESAYHTLLQSQILFGKKEVHILLTHMHPDHVAGLGSLIFHLNTFYRITPIIYVPDGNIPIYSFLENQGITYETASFHVYPTYSLTSTCTEIQSINVLKNVHMKGVKAYSYLIGVLGKMVYYSGDGKLNAEALGLLKNNEIDEFYQDTCSVNNSKLPHCTLHELTLAISSNLRNKVYCIHRDLYASDSKIVGMGFNAPSRIKLYDSVDFSTQIKQYRDTKDITREIVTAAKAFALQLPTAIYRGDCTYMSMLEEGKTFKFHNLISSWSFDKDIAKCFANSNCAPDWYFDASEWCMLDPYPFEEPVKNGEELVPVLFILEESEVHGLLTSDYIDVANDRDYVNRDEKEVILGDVNFKIEKINDEDSLKVIYLKLYNEQQVNNF